MGLVLASCGTARAVRPAAAGPRRSGSPPSSGRPASPAGLSSGSTGSVTGPAGATGPTVNAPPLVGWGATRQNWSANHHADPLAAGSGGYWPRLPNGLDNYASVHFVGGRAERYTINLYPSEAVSGAVTWVLDELPPDAKLLRSVSRPPSGADAGCQEMVFSSAVLAARLHADVLARAFSAGPSLDPSAVVAVRLSPLPDGTETLPRC